MTSKRNDFIGDPKLSFPKHNQEKTEDRMAILQPQADGRFFMQIHQDGTVPDSELR